MLLWCWSISEKFLFSFFFSIVNKKLQLLGIHPSYVVLSNDKLGGRDKTLAALRTNLKSGNSCVIDNTHVDVEARRKFLEVAKELKYPVRAFIMTTTFFYHLD